MQAKPYNMYVLKDLYAEIGFFDRKIAHCQAFEKSTPIRPAHPRCTSWSRHGKPW